MADNIFTHLKNLTEDKVLPDFKSVEFQKSYDPYMINRYISMCQMYISDVIPMNLFGDLIPKETQYRYYYNALPNRSVFFKYIKKSKNNISKDDEKVLVRHFECGSKDFKEIMKYIGEDEVKKILKIYEK